MGNVIAADQKILVVDDDALVRFDLVSALSDAGFRALEAGSADDAHALLTGSGDISVMITDVELFGTVDGVDLAWSVRQTWPHVHIIVISGYQRACELRLPDRAQFFTKPYHAPHVVCAIRDMLR